MSARRGDAVTPAYPLPSPSQGEDVPRGKKRPAHASPTPGFPPESPDTPRYPPDPPFFLDTCQPPRAFPNWEFEDFANPLPPGVRRCAKRPGRRRRRRRQGRFEKFSGGLCLYALGVGGTWRHTQAHTCTHTTSVDPMSAPMRLRELIHHS